MDKILKQRRMKEILLKILIISIVIIFQYLATDFQKHYVNLFAMCIAFAASLYLHKQFFPFFTLAIGLFIMASVQELYDIHYPDLPITKSIYLFARLMFAVAIIEPFITKIFKNEKL